MNKRFLHPCTSLPSGANTRQSCAGPRRLPCVGRGFSLIETLVATAIIVMATTGPLALAARSLTQANYIKDQIGATFLAQEGLEIMRNIRDVKGIAQIGQLQAGICSTDCMVSGTEIAGDTYKVLTTTTGGKLKFDSVTNIYDYSTDSSATPSIYSRVIRIEKISDKEFKVHSIVSWNRADTRREIDLTANLFERTW